MAEDLINCDRPLRVLITSPLGDWSFIYYIVDTVQSNMSNTPHQHNISFNTMITDHVVRNMDTVTINGSISCIRGCSSRVSGDFNTVIGRLKRLKEEMLYDRSRFATLTSNDWQFRYAILTDVSVTESQDQPQRKMISTTWTGANLAGLVYSPFFDRGGFVIQ